MLPFLLALAQLLGPAQHLGPAQLLGPAEAPAEALALATAPAVDATPTLVLLRHAETAPDGTRDPALSEAGRERARELAELFAGAGVTQVWSTDLRRTRQTAAPLARAAGLEVRIYDPFDPSALREATSEAAGTVVIVGHSNTTPALAEALGGRAGPPIDESEYDRIYVLLPGGPDDEVRTLRLRYGRSTPPEASARP